MKGREGIQRPKWHHSSPPFRQLPGLDESALRFRFVRKAPSRRMAIFWITIRPRPNFRQDAKWALEAWSVCICGQEEGTARDARQTYPTAQCRRSGGDVEYQVVGIKIVSVLSIRTCQMFRIRLLSHKVFPNRAGTRQGPTAAAVDIGASGLL